MSLALTPLDPGQLGPDAQRALSSAPAKQVAARGLAPIQDPADLVSVLYQLALEEDAALRSAASASAAELPARVLKAALADPRLDPRVLEFFARRVAGEPDLVEPLLLNPATADETVAAIARGASSRIVDLIATNEQRLLRHPQIIAAMYMNRQARMAAVDRAVELAVRNQVRVPGIPAWDEICEGILERGRGAQAGEPEPPDVSEEEFQEILARGDRADERGEAPDSPRDEKDWHRMSVPTKIRLAMIGGAAFRSRAITDPKLVVARAAVKSPSAKEGEVLKWAGNHALPGEIIKAIARKREWVQNYAIKVALVNNPKTPVAEAMRLVPHLREREVRALARSRAVPFAVVALARKLHLKRTGGGGGGGR